MKRGQSGLSGIIAVDKPAGITSHDVVDRVRRMTGERRVGHAGTLDPMATGLMFVCVGAATRLSQYLMGHDKSYCARFMFGLSTDTDDKEGRVLPGYDVAQAQHNALAALPADPSSAVDGMVGTQLQLPPAYSAIKKNGTVAYKAAREGKNIELETRQITVHEAQFIADGIDEVRLVANEGSTDSVQLPFWDIVLNVSKGTYIRALARDLGIRLGCGAFLGALRRTCVASTTVNEALTIEQLGEACEKRGVPVWTDPVEALGFASYELDDEQAQDVKNGRKLDIPCVEDTVCCTHDGRLLALYERDGNAYKALTVIPGGVAGAK